MDTLDPRSTPEDRGQNLGAGTPVGGGYAATPSYGTPGAGWSQSSFDPWNYRADSGWSADYDLVGYHIEATDGSIGKIDESSHAMNESYLVVDTGPWIFGKKVLLPAGTVTRVDHADRKIYVDRTKDQIKSSPEFDPDMYMQSEYRNKIGGYYDDTYRNPDVER